MFCTLSCNCPLIGFLNMLLSTIYNMAGSHLKSDILFRCTWKGNEKSFLLFFMYNVRLNCVRILNKKYPTYSIQSNHLDLKLSFPKVVFIASLLTSNLMI